MGQKNLPVVVSCTGKFLWLLTATWPCWAAALLTQWTKGWVGSGHATYQRLVRLMQGILRESKKGKNHEYFSQFVECKVFFESEFVGLDVYCTLILSTSNIHSNPSLFSIFKNVWQKSSLVVVVEFMVY